MQNRILLIINIILSIILVVIRSSSDTTSFYSEPNIKIKDPVTNTINSINLEEYVIGVVAAEMPASFDIEALKAQAVAARTYAKYKMQNKNKEYDVVTDVSNQSYITLEQMQNKWDNEFEKYYSKIANAVKETEGLIMYYDGLVVEAYYFAMSNGYTEEAEHVFSEGRDYLQSVESKYDTSTKNFEVTTTFSKSEVCERLNINCDGLNFSNIKRSNTNRVNTITVNNVEFKGTSFRTKLGLRSTDFNITEQDNIIIITTKGYGHGVGMSQYGANGMAKDGYTYDEILKYYYKNIEISSI